jgi:hypothetical protein
MPSGGCTMHHFSLEPTTGLVLTGGEARAACLVGVLRLVIMRVIAPVNRSEVRVAEPA